MEMLNKKNRVIITIIMLIYNYNVYTMHDYLKKIALQNIKKDYPMLSNSQNKIPQKSTNISKEISKNKLFLNVKELIVTAFPVMPFRVLLPIIKSFIPNCIQLGNEYLSGALFSRILKKDDIETYLDLDNIVEKKLSNKTTTYFNSQGHISKKTYENNKNINNMPNITLFKTFLKIVLMVEKPELAILWSLDILNGALGNERIITTKPESIIERSAREILSTHALIPHVELVNNFNAIAIAKHICNLNNHLNQSEKYDIIIFSQFLTKIIKKTYLFFTMQTDQDNTKTMQIKKLLLDVFTNNIDVYPFKQSSFKENVVLPIIASSMYLLSYRPSPIMYFFGFTPQNKHTIDITYFGNRAFYGKDIPLSLEKLCNHTIFAINYPYLHGKTITLGLFKAWHENKYKNINKDNTDYLSLLYF